MSTNSVGSRIKWAREQAGLTQAQLGALLDTDQAAVSKWESGEISPRGSTRLRIGKALGANYEWLRTGVGDWRLSSVTSTDASAFADLGEDDEGVTIALEFTNNFIKTFGVKLSDHGKMILALFFSRMYTALNAKSISDIHHQNMGLFVSDMLKRIHTGEIK